MFRARHPRLAPWAAFFRRFAAACLVWLRLSSGSALVIAERETLGSGHDLEDGPSPFCATDKASVIFRCRLSWMRWRMSRLGPFPPRWWTKLVNLIKTQIGACNFSHSSAINNPPRAEVWQPVVFCLNLSCPSGIWYLRGWKAL